jgi:hypothetical protein
MAAADQNRVNQQLLLDRSNHQKAKVAAIQKKRQLERKAALDKYG